MAGSTVGYVQHWSNRNMGITLRGDRPPVAEHMAVQIEAFSVRDRKRTVWCGPINELTAYLLWIPFIGIIWVNHISGAFDVRCGVAHIDGTELMAGPSRYKPERVVFDGTGDFMKILRARIHETLDGRAPAGDPRLLRKAAVIAIWFVGSFFLLLSVQSPWLQLLFCFSYGLAASAVGFNIFHDANHGALSPNRRVNLIVGATASAVLGASRYLWNYKHNVLHHRLTNIHTWDDDLETRGFLRLTPRQRWKPRYYGQHVFVFVLYAINAIELVFVKDFVQYFTLRINPHQSIPALSRAEKMEFWAAKAFYLAIFVALPFAIQPTVRVLEGFAVYQLTLGLSLGLVFSMAHQVESVDFPLPRGAPPTIDEDWGTHQMRTTANFATLNRGWNWFSGGLNHQIEHHLFPAMSHTHYVAIGPVVRSTAGEFGLPYNHFETYGAALQSHYRLLRGLGTRPPPANVR